MRSLRLAVRTLLRNKSAYLPASGILALGIGMSVAMFSLVDAVLLRPLPFPRQQSIHVIWKMDPLAGNHVEELAYPELRDLQENIADFESVAVMPTSLYGYARVLQTGTAEPVQIESAPVSHDFFRVLGVSPMLGRDFNASDERVGAPPVVILSDRVWREELGGARGIVGQMIRLNGQGHTVIGVMEPGVEFPRGAGLWVPLGTEARIVERRGATFLQAIARAKPGIGLERIRGEVNALFQRLAIDHPEAYTRSQQAVVTPLVEYWTGSARQHLWIMLGASLLLWVASVLSAANLLLTRARSRRHEMATRLALGASRAQILAPLGAEGMAVAILAAGAGLGIAQIAIRVLVRWAPADIPRLAAAGWTLNSFCFAAGTAALSAVTCTLIPGWSTVRMRARRGDRTRSGFILVQTALTVTLLAMACLLALSYRFMMSADTGFANRDAVTMNLQLRGPGVLAGQGLDQPTRRRFYQDLLARLRESPGIDSAAAILLRPLEGTIGWDVSYQFEFEAQGPDKKVLPKANYEVITPGYFKTVGTSLIEGRDFDDHDSEGGEAVVIISQSLAQRIRSAGYAPLGHRLRQGLDFEHWSKVVGVVSDARYRNITQRGADIFVPYLQAAQPTNYVVIRGTLTAQETTALVRRKLVEADPGQAIAGVATIGELIDSNAVRHRFNMVLLLWFGVCAAVLAATAVYSVIAESMAARRREIAIRNALGAQRSWLVRDMVSGTLRSVLIGEALGSGLVLVLGRSVAGLFYEVSAKDPLVLSSVAGFVFLVSLLAAVWPAWFAAEDGSSQIRSYDPFL